MLLVSFPFLFFNIQALFLLSPHMESLSGFSARCLQMDVPCSELKISISRNFRDMGVLKPKGSRVLPLLSNRKVFFLLFGVFCAVSFPPQASFLSLFPEIAFVSSVEKMGFNMQGHHLLLQELRVLSQFFGIADGIVKL